MAIASSVTRGHFLLQRHDGPLLGSSYGRGPTLMCSRFAVPEALNALSSRHCLYPCRKGTEEDGVSLPSKELLETTAGPILGYLLSKQQGVVIICHLWKSNLNFPSQ